MPTLQNKPMICMKVNQRHGWALTIEEAIAIQLEFRLKGEKKRSAM